MSEKTTSNPTRRIGRRTWDDDMDSYLPRDDREWGGNDDLFDMGLTKRPLRSNVGKPMSKKDLDRI